LLTSEAFVDKNDSKITSSFMRKERGSDKEKGWGEGTGGGGENI
jgi:hypothetical protein